MARWVGRVQTCRAHLSMGLPEEAAEALVPQRPQGELRVLPGLRLLQPQLQLPQGTQLLHQLPLTRPAGLEVQLQVQGGARRLLGQGGAVRLLLRHAQVSKMEGDDGRKHKT